MAGIDERERQRFEHLVLGKPRPSTGRTRKVRKRAVLLVPGVEARVQIRERWSHKAEGTAETHEHVAMAQRRPGSLARLHASGAIDDDQLAAAEGILDAWRGVVAGVAVRTASLEARVDGGGHGKAEGEMLGRVHADLAYGRWRQAVGGDAAAVLDVVVHDQGLTIVARRYRMSMARARRMLVVALDQWWLALHSLR